jgi:hypothetical protein
MMFVSRIKSGFDEPAAANGTPPLRSWPTFVAAMIGEVHAGATPEQARGFFNAVGRRIAALAPVEDIEDTSALIDRINALWAAMGWGSVSLSFDDEGIDILHEQIPRALGHEDGGLWMANMGHVLEGAYDSWFRSLGSGRHLRTRVTEQSADKLELRHGL